MRNVMTLKIRVTNIWCHPEFGGTKERTKTYSMDQSEKAAQLYAIWTQGDNLYSHTTISIYCTEG